MRLQNNPIRHKLLLFIAVLFVFCNTSWAQDIVITGTVTNGNSGEPLPGVNVIIEGSQLGTVTNLDGMYEISLPSGLDKLNFSFIGFLSESIQPGGRTIIDVRLIPDIEELDEVVVIGYGTMRKKDLTGAVTSVTTADIQANKSTNALQTLQGKVAGLDLTQDDGQAGADISITMRGIRSLSASNDPLILVDGVEYGSTLDINTSDIESVDILKDVASTAIYGTKGSNGVILITTKRGGEGKTSVTYSNYFSYNMPTFIPHIMSGQEYQEKQFQIQIAHGENELWYDESGVEYIKETGEVTWDEAANPEPWDVFGSVTLDQLIADKGAADKYELLTEDPTGLELLRNNASLDYLDMIMVNSWSQNHELSIQGGNNKSAFNISFGLMDDNGLLRNDNMKRYNLNIGVDHAINKSMKIGTNIFYTYKEYNKRDGSIFNQALKCGPIGTLYNVDGTYKDIPDPVFADNQVSPMLDEAPGAQIHDILSNRIFGSTHFDWEIFNGLSFRSNFGINIDLAKEGKFNSGNSIQQHTNRESRADLIYSDNKSYTWNNILTYKKSIGVHNIQLMAGSETFQWVMSGSEMTGYNQPLETTQYYDFKGIVQEDRDYSSEFAEKQMVSFFSRINYGLFDKYLFQATLRYDGASQLYPGNKWDMFPSLSAGWRISEENFLAESELVSNLKLRYSWGIAGNAAVPPYSSKTKLSNDLSYYTFGETVFSQYLPFRLGNSELSWEKTASHNMGIDFGLFKNRLIGAIDYYISNTKDLLFKVPLPPVNAYPETWDNVAATKNQGIELALSGLLMKKKAFEWSVNLNFSHNKGEIIELREGQDELVHSVDKIWRVGNPVDAYYVYENVGVYQIADLQAELQYVSQQNATGDSIERFMIPMLSNQAEPGDIKLVDHNGDGEFNKEDKIVLDASPKFLFGFGTSFNLNTKVGDFGIRINAIGRLGGTISYGFYDRFKDSKDKTNSSYVETWTPQNTDAVFPRYSLWGNNFSSIHKSSLKFVEGSFVKIKEITLSYTLPGIWTNNLKIENLQVYATARNMFIFSKIENYDPEQRGGYDFPLQKNIIFGINVNF